MFDYGMVCVCHLSTQKMEEEVQDSPQLHSKLVGSLGYGTLCLSQSSTGSVAESLPSPGPEEQGRFFSPGS